MASLEREVLKDRCGGQGEFEVRKGALAVDIEVKHGVFAGEVDKWARNSAIVFDKTVVEIAEAKKTLYTFDGGWRGPVDDAADLVGINLEASGGHDVAKIFGSSNLKLAFVDICLQAGVT